MTQEFRDLTTRLAKALNFDEGSVLLITCKGDINDGNVFMKGSTGVITVGICGAIDVILKKTNDDKFAATVRQMITERIIADEERRFQKKGVSEE